MAISKRFKVIEEENGVNYIFSNRDFKIQVGKRQNSSSDSSNKITQEQIFEELAEKLHKSAEAVRQWFRGNNGPSDIDVVKDIANYFGVDYKELLSRVEAMPQRNGNFEFSFSGLDEKSIIIDFHSFLTEFIYEYIGTDLRDPYVERQYGISGNELDIEIEDYIFSLYKELEKVALKVSPDTYKKLHRFITECKMFATVGTDEATPHMSSLVYVNPRWKDINPHLDIIAVYSESLDFDEALIGFSKDEVNELTKDLREEAGACYIGNLYGNDFVRYVPFTREPLSEEENSKYISEDEHWNYYYHKPDEAVPMELAKTMTMLFRADFPQFFS